MNKDLKIFLISGKARHGKDTTSDILKDALIAQGKRVLVTHYADLVKYICKTFFGWDGNKDERGRSILQYVGTEVVREKRPNYWVEFVMEILWLFGDNWDCIIIPDARFPNEISFPKDTYDNVYHINVVRPNFDNGLTEEQKNHSSETALDGITPDFLIENTSLYELEKSILRVLTEIEKGKDEE
jgi:hypothetical protein